MDRNILHEFFAGEASAKNKEQIKSWIENPENNETLIRERELFNALLLLDRKNLNYEEKQKTRFRIRPVLKEILRTAAIVVLIVGMGTLFYMNKMNDINSATNTVYVPHGQRVKLTLPDGSHVSVNADSELKYPAYFSGSKREVQLNGEAFFEVKHNGQKPFLVHTSKVEIEVLGTEFNVEDYSTSDDFSVALLTGSVKLTNTENRSDILILEPDYQAAFFDGKLTTSLIPDYDYFRWQEGLICFKNMEFQELMIRFEKYYNVEIKIENKEVSSKAFSGKFRVSDGIDNALRILQKDAKYTYEKNKEGNLIYIKMINQENAYE